MPNAIEQIERDRNFKMYTEKELANMGIASLSTLRQDRAAKRGIPFFKMNGRVKYSKADVVRYLKSKRVETKY